MLQHLAAQSGLVIMRKFDDNLNSIRETQHTLPVRPLTMLKQCMIQQHQQDTEVCASDFLPTAQCGLVTMWDFNDQLNSISTTQHIMPICTGLAA